METLGTDDTVSPVSIAGEPLPSSKVDIQESSPMLTLGTDDTVSPVSIAGEPLSSSIVDIQESSPMLTESTRPTRRKRSRPLTFPTVDLVPELAKFKTTPPSTFTFKKEYRPFMGRACQRCSNYSRDLFYHKDVPMMGIVNVAPIRRHCILEKFFPYLHFVVNIKNNCTYPDPKSMISDAVQNKRIQSAIHTSAMIDSDGAKDEEIYQRAAHKHAGRALHVIKRMSATILNVALRITGYLLLRTLSFLVGGIHVHQGQVEMIKQASKRNVPIIFVPLHRSHLDYLLLSLVCFVNNIPVPFIAAGDNLNLPIIGWWFRHIGAFFIKRKLDKEIGKKDIVYRAALHTIMEQILIRNQNMEFYIEGGRTRSGKALAPKGGLLSVVIDAYMDGVIADAFLVPASVSYERILEGNFNEEQMGMPKKKESLFLPFRTLWNAFHSNFGHIRINYAQPISLKEYLDSAQRYVPPTSDMAFRPRLMKAISDNSLYGTDVVLEDQRQLIRGLGEHIIVDSQWVTTIMSTNLLAFLLLTKHRRGVSMNQLVTDFEAMRQDVMSRRRDIGFSGESQDIVKHAISILGEKLVKSQSRQMNPDVVPSPTKERDEIRAQREVIIPNTSLPNIFELSYYSNAVLSIFVMESVVANAVVSIVNDSLIAASNNPYKIITVSRSKVIQKAEELCDLLQFEFIFTRPCENLVTSISEAIDNLILSDLLTQPKDVLGSNADSQWARRIARNTFWEGEENDTASSSYQNDIHLEVATSPECLDQLYFFQKILGPLIEGYWLSACNLVRLTDTEMSEAEFSRITNIYAKERVTKGLASYAESCAMDTLRNSWKVFSHWNIIKYYYTKDSGKMVRLDGVYRSDSNQLSLFIDKIESFRNLMG